MHRRRLRPPPCLVLLEQLPGATPARPLPPRRFPEDHQICFDFMHIVVTGIRQYLPHEMSFPSLWLLWMQAGTDLLGLQKGQMPHLKKIHRLKEGHGVYLFEGHGVYLFDVGQSAVGLRT
ncbi:uncharacterized protein LOC125215390 isoform X1 [Salvia hispanica]|uniref:uncharacterized protein LOC125215390 isoform X1 n=1 Tax=Salvia hispanica TaxID=49212 RepID=UPI002009A7C7|nr:uncharacterized protein LOC125215390 isoform X1 [Salvia hispanica]